MNKQIRMTASEVDSYKHNYRSNKLNQKRHSLDGVRSAVNE